MKNNNGNNTWINLFLFFLVIDKPETVLDLIQSDNCEKEFTDIVQRIVTMESKRFQHTCIDWLMKHREKLMELNKVYKTNRMRLPSVTPKAESCEDDISRQVVHDIWHTTYPTVRIGNEEIQYKKIAYDLPSVTPSRPKGKWIKAETEGRFYCSICGGIHNDTMSGEWREVFDFKYSYCPNCGADMRESEDKE